MKILKQTKKAVQVELSPLELEVLRGAMVKEFTARNRALKQANCKYPEELMYHCVMKDTSEHMKIITYKGIDKYRSWKILK